MWGSLGSVVIRLSTIGPVFCDRSISMRYCSASGEALNTPVNSRPSGVCSWALQNGAMWAAAASTPTSNREIGRWRRSLATVPGELPDPDAVSVGVCGSAITSLLARF